MARSGRLLDGEGNRLKDKSGDAKTLRHKFTIYCVGICAGSDNVEALISCSTRAGIQVKASKVKGHELQLPVFYRGSFSRLLALEKFRNQIEGNVGSGITLYTDPKPGLYESSLSNKGQLSAYSRGCSRIKISYLLWRTFIDKEARYCWQIH